jgi:hypothetical protein
MIRKRALTAAELDALKLIGSSSAAGNSVNPWILAHLLAADLVSDDDGSATLTELGRAAVVRGAPENWGIAA